MIIAHRGESYIAPENSLSAIILAWQKGAQAVEIDVHLSSDNEIVVIHDHHTGRVGDVKYKIAKSSLQKLKSVNIGGEKAHTYPNEKIPALREVIKTIPKHGKLIIEIKCGQSIIQPLSKELQNSGLEDHQFEIIAFDLKTLTMAKKRMPQYKMLWLLDLDYYKPYWMVRKNPARLIQKVIISNLDGVNLWAGKVLNKKFVEAFKNAGLLVYCWTVNDIMDAEKRLEYGVDAITSDRPSWLTKQLTENK